MKRQSKQFVIAIIAALIVMIPLFGWAKDIKTISPTTSALKATKVKVVTKTAKPDLVISKINYSPGSPVEKDEITIWVFVKNIGKAAAGTSKVRFRIGGESHPPVMTVPALIPGKELRFTRKITFNKKGNYIVTAAADAENSIVESNESNNVKKKTITVRPAPKPDLIVSKINFSNASPQQGEQIRVWIFVKNIGPGKSPAYSCKVSKTNSLNSSPIWSDKLVPALDPGKEWRWDAYFISNSPGTWTITAEVDRAKKLDETNENNNILSKPITVRAK